MSEAERYAFAEVWHQIETLPIWEEGDVHKDDWYSRS